MVGFRTCRVHCCKSLWQKSCYFIWPTTPTWTLYAMKILKNLSQRTLLQCNRKKTPTILASGPLYGDALPIFWRRKKVFSVSDSDRKPVSFQWKIRLYTDKVRVWNTNKTRLRIRSGATSTGSWKRNKNNKNAGILTKIILINWWKNAELNVVKNTSQMYCIFLYFNYP